MRACHPLPNIWLMTDPRGGDPVKLMRRQRQRIGVIVRHYEWSPGERRALTKRLVRAASGKHLVIAAASPMMAWQWGAAGAHNRSHRKSRGLRTVAVHTAREAALARMINADLIFVSPIRSTRSHPSARPIGLAQAIRIAGTSRHRAIALGGMNAQHFRRISVAGFYGWAGIDAFA